MNKKPNTPLVKFKNFNSVWISDQVKNLFDISRGQFLTKDQIKSRPVERERERERADTSTRFIHHKQKITGF
ncbi:hypothetical protein R7U62_02820 [Mesomycoplasma ovipneumoniae]|uniref:hypothetical protein n=1 Tax=Mesomycoplasma ovipneumoniae TaxID=29562 RepID=UPI0029640ABC|nr:hypothetical protein [Mesomycoplasma ovipneumoniae]MDW2913019.1 hypothetical protein [Mesomycoplasma ovipneumoniae]MDW2933045.1 hypothetical protein [Mesomycoplasma ovipneumoniae]